MQPEDYKVTRSASITAQPETIFAQVNDLHSWQTWSPWAKIDPNAKITYAGPQSGAGASFSWAGNSEIGEGKMTIVESRPSELITFRLDFIKPFAGTANAEFTFHPVQNQTLVTWTMSGKNNFIGKAISLVFDCDKMIGENFEKGLASLRTITEGPAGIA